ncbi:hypothetical protein N7478_001313, partial [Penicillium angulare]|uniref:uncharacterized protein n=1 Tax=Penicillium angulare TaxID=116970 RepID=UPI0025408BED
YNIGCLRVKETKGLEAGFLNKRSLYKYRKGAIGNISILKIAIIVIPSTLKYYIYYKDQSKTKPLIKLKIFLNNLKSNQNSSLEKFIVAPYKKPVLVLQYLEYPKDITLYYIVINYIYTYKDIL